ncbi:kelch-like protein 38 isoform X3 [Styela clava]
MEVERTIPVDKNAHDAGILENLNRMRENKIFCDFLIKVGSEEIPVHKNVVSAGSGYFKAMLSHDTKESQAGVVDIKESNPVCVKKCIEFIYTGTGSVADENREELMFVANMMQLQRLCDGIAVFLEDDLCAESFVSTKRIATTFGCKNLDDYCNKFAFEHFCQIATSDDFKFLEKKYVSFLLHSSDVKASVADKCKALIIWTNYEPSGRAEQFEENFKTLDFSKLQFEYIKYLVENEPLIHNSMPCWKSLFMMVMSQVSSKDHEFMAIAIFYKTSNSLQGFYPETKTWKTIKTLPNEISKKKFLAVLLDNDVYILGYDKTNFCLQNYTETNSTWQKLADRLVMGRLRAVVHGGAIYVFDDSSRTSTAVEKYDLLTRSWSSFTNKPVSGYECAVVSANGFIFCIGGIDGNRSVTTNQKLDPSVAKWSTAKPMPSGRCFAAAVSLNKSIYVLGGSPWGDCLSTAICFDITTETWTSVANMNLERSQFGSCILGNKIYAVGGSGPGSSTIEEYDDIQNKWKTIENLTGKGIFSEASFALCLPT